MSDFYTNVYQHKGNILVRGYLNGKRYLDKVAYRPYLFLPSKTPTPYRNLKEEYVVKKNFSSIYEARNFLKQFDDVDNFTYYGLEKFAYTYIYDTFKGDIVYDPNVLKRWNIDIETDSKDGFAEPDKANKPITLIGVRTGHTRIVYGWIEDYKPKDEHVIYIRCVNEKDMLERFLTFWESEEGPDIVTGWNIEGYDIPYLVNRVEAILGEGESKRFSPWGLVNTKTIEFRGREINTYTFVGISILDYLPLYRKFTYTQQESYSLDHIAFVETSKRKLDYSEYESLADLCERNYEKFVDYNIADMDRVADIDEKNKFIDLALAIAYDAKVNHIDALTSVLLWDVICHNFLMDQSIVIPKFTLKEFRDIEGAYVKEPQIGLHEDVVSFDVESEYPHAIIQFNISPETFVDIDPWDDKTLWRFIREEFEIDHSYIQAGNGARFRKDKIGFLPQLMKKQFILRKQYKKKMLECKALYEAEPTKEMSNKVAQFNNLQMAKKIQLNSLYGSLANRYCRYYDWRLASAITLSGQLCVNTIQVKLNEYLNKLLKTDNFDYVIAMDTDSVYANFHPLIKQVGLVDLEKRVEFLDKISQEKISPLINKWFEHLANRVNANENAMVMKREAIADKAIWKAAKMYMMNVLDEEGVRFKDPKLKMKGIEAVKSSTPQVCRDAIRDAIKIIMQGDVNKFRSYVNQYKDKFKTLTFEEVAFPRGINNVDEYSDSVLIYKKGTPIHVRAALIYNNMLKKHGLLKTHTLINNKDKIKFCYLKMPNPAHSNVIAAPRALPSQFGMDKHIDYDLQFEKTFLEPVKSITDAIGWELEESTSLESFFA